MRLQPERPLPGAKWFAIAVAAAVLAIWLVHLDTPFSRVYGFADWIGNWNGRIARNYIRYGFADTLGAQVMNLEPVTSTADRVLYHGHPATLDIVTSLAFRVFGDGVWVHRLLPLLASLASLVAMHAVLARHGRDPWPGLALFACFPLFAVHGVNLSYEPFCLPALLGILLAFERGSRFGLVVLVFAGGLIDFPVLYVAPVLALRARRLGFGLAVGCAAVAAVGAHVAHTALAFGGLQGNQGLSLIDKVWQSFAPPHGTEPSLAQLADRCVAHFTMGFTVPGLLLIGAGLVLVRRLGFVALATAWVGVLHCVAFRAHFVRHDFWPWYLLPVAAIAGGRFLGRVPRGVAWSLLVVVSVPAFTRTLTIWAERRDVAVRAVAADLHELFPDEAVLHQLRAPAGWALETERGHPVLEGADLVAQIELGGGFGPYLDNLGGTWGYLDRPQLAFMPVAATRPGDLELMDRIAGPGRRSLKRGRFDSYHVWDLSVVLTDPGRVPYLRIKLDAAELDRLTSRARLFLILPHFEPGARFIWLDGRASGSERLRGRTVRGGDASALAGWHARDRWSLVAWPGTPWATRLAVRAGDRLQFVEMRTRSGSIRLPVVRPD